MDKLYILKTLGLSEEEIETLKEIHRERLEYGNFEEKFRVYEDLQEKVPVNEKAVRRTYSITSSTIEELDEFVAKYRLPKEDVVELAIKNFLEQYHKE